jgi:CRP-like cAMP-binding protein
MAIPCDLGFLLHDTILSGLKPQIAERVIASASVVRLRKGEPLVQQGDRATAFFIVIDGWVKLYRTTLSGKEVVIDVLSKAESFAAAAALSGDCYPVAAQVVSDACVARIPADRVVGCIREVPEVAIPISASSLQHIDRLLEHIDELRSQSMLQRAAAFLASLCPVANGPCVAALPYGKTLIAARLGMDPESLSRTFFKLGLVGVRMRAWHFAVSDVAKLRQLAAEGHIRSYAALSFRGAPIANPPSDAPRPRFRCAPGTSRLVWCCQRRSFRCGSRERLAQGNKQ